MSVSIPPARPNQFERRIVVLGKQEVGVTTYPVGSRWSCRVDNVDPGAIIARGSGATKEEAVEVALAMAALTLDMQDEIEAAKGALRQSVEELRKNANARGSK